MQLFKAWPAVGPFWTCSWIVCTISQPALSFGDSNQTMLDTVGGVACGRSCCCDYHEREVCNAIQPRNSVVHGTYVLQHLPLDASEGLALILTLPIRQRVLTVLRMGLKRFFF